MSAEEVCLALEVGLRKRHPDAEIIRCPLADGGDGSLAVLARYLDLDTVVLPVSDPLGRPMEAGYRRAGSTAYIELSTASGLVLLAPEERHCVKTTSYGTGQLIAHALANGIYDLYLFIGGSATNEGGIGIAEALGYRFYSHTGELLAPVGENLIHIHRIDSSGVIVDLQKLRVTVVCDVDNPLYGPQGAAYTYGPQKGATPAELELLDRGLANLATRLRDHGYPEIGFIPGAGAAGGIGGGLVAFLNAQLRSGTATFLEISRLEEHLRQADLVITGEGKLDAQTVQGKLISGVCHLAHLHGKPIVGVCGAADAGVAESLGMERIYTVLERSASLEEAMRNAAQKLTEIGGEIV